jgi:hypothetical protein
MLNNDAGYGNQHLRSSLPRPQGLPKPQQSAAICNGPKDTTGRTTGKVSPPSQTGKVCLTVAVNHLVKITSIHSRGLNCRADTKVCHDGISMICQQIMFRARRATGQSQVCQGLAYTAPTQHTVETQRSLGESLTADKLLTLNQGRFRFTRESTFRATGRFKSCRGTIQPWYGRIEGCIVRVAVSPHVEEILFDEMDKGFQRARS